MRRRLLPVLAFTLLTLAVSVAPLAATGTVVLTRTLVFSQIHKVTIAWTSDGSGNVNTNPFTPPTGELLQVKFIPGAGGTQPTNLYGATLVDQDGVDVLDGNGASLSNTTSTVRTPLTGDGASGKTHRFLIDGAETLDLQISAAGASKTGTVILWIGR